MQLTYFISPDQWPPNSPDMNSVDYKIWAVCNATAGLWQTRKWRRRAVSAPVECVAQHWTKRHRRSDRSVACATHCLCTSRRGSFWAPDVENRLELNVSTVTWHFESVLNWIWACCISTHLTFQVLQGSAATDLRWGENFNKFLLRKSLLYIAVKKLRKSVNICLSYRKNKSVSFFYGPQCSIMIMW